jgi:response regulator RpfG family c-di-GMP phosphodiesterase
MGTAANTSKRVQFLSFCRYLRSLYPTQIQIMIICGTVSPHPHTRTDKRVSKTTATTGPFRRKGWDMREKAKILLVDDRPGNLLALESVLSALDQTLVRAHSGEAALKALLTDEFAVILLDVQMPGMDGFETAAHIKRRERTRDIPIIFLTAVHHGPQHTFRGYMAGAVDYLSKPFDPWVLRAKVSIFVELHHKNRQLREQARLLQQCLGARVGDAQEDADLGELSRHLAAVEEQVTALCGQAQVGVDKALAASVVHLERRVARLRAALDALAVSC